MKAQRDDDGWGGGGTLLGDKTGVETVVLGPITLQGAGARTSAGLPLTCVHSWPYACSVPSGAKFAGSYAT
jgi:hypothetical protein